jgi:phosphatidylglycerol lysyltransferase
MDNSKPDQIDKPDNILQPGNLLPNLMLPRELIRPLMVKLSFLITLGSGFVNLYSVVGQKFPQRLVILEEIFPLEFIHLSKFLTILVGFALIIASINIYKRKRRAFQGVILLSILSIIFHLIKGLNYEEALVSLALILILGRKEFIVKSRIQTLPMAFVRSAIAFGIAILYGAAGFWLIEQRHFHLNFRWRDALSEAFRYMTFVGDPDLIPYTRHAAWFLDSLYLISITAVVYAIYSLYRPAVYKFRVYPRELALAKSIVENHGRSAMDFFKYWSDKSFYFSPSQKSFIAYRVGNNFAVALGDPVGPESEIRVIADNFISYCLRNDWGFSFYQVVPDFLPIYEALRLKRLKIGDDAIVELTNFTLEGKARKSLRQAVNRLEESGVSSSFYQPPIPEEIIAELAGISDLWLKLPGHRERGFTLGQFERSYIRATPLIVAKDKNGKSVAFINQIPSYFAGEATIDLMRRTGDSPNGIMDYLFARLFLILKEQGFNRFNMGMAPMAGFAESEESSAEEKAIHFLFQHMNFLFRYRGLRNFKAKFASSWEPRYAIYKNPFDLPKLALALRDILEIKG